MHGQQRTGVSALTVGVVVLSAAFLLIHQVLRPFPASVLTYTDQSLRYRDVPFPVEEAAGISLLTSLGAVEGYPDGTFRPGNTLNRAEFLKIVLKSSPSFQEISLHSKRCFPDVHREDWFSPFVCFGQEQGVVTGYPDGLFRPENPVNYVEALKILVGIYKYPLTAAANDMWFSPHVRVAGERGVLLFPDLPLSTSLTRGQMARLASAFRAEHEKELSRYLAEEQGKSVPPPQGSSVSSETTISSPSSLSEELLPPIRSHFLLLGTVSEPIADALFTNDRGEAFLRKIDVRLDRKVKSLRNIRVSDAKGNEIATLSVDTNDTEERKNWLATVSGSGFHIPIGGTLHLQFYAEIFGRGSGGVVGELVRIDRIAVVIQGVSGESSWELTPTEKHTPYHQTVQGRVASLRNILGKEGILEEGTDRVIGAFAIAGEELPETMLSIEEFQFTVESSGVEVSKWRLGREGRGTVECFWASDNDRLVACPILEDDMGSAGSDPVIFKAIADVRIVGTNEPTLRLLLDLPGGVGEEGAVRWSDGTGHYNWLDVPRPVAEGTLWKVK